MSETTRTKLEAIAKARGMTLSKVYRKALDEFVEREIVKVVEPEP